MEVGRSRGVVVVRRLLCGLAVFAGLACGGMESAAWRAYEAVEEAWLRECHAFVVQQAPAAMNAASIDLEIRLTELKRRAVEFRHLQKCEPNLFEGGIWKLTSITLSPEESAHIAASIEHRRLEQKVKDLESALHRHPQYSILRRAQIRLWKTPQYRDAHRRYTGRLQELQAQYGGPMTPSGSTVN